MTKDKCNRCGEVGHWAVNCLLKRNDGRKEKPVEKADHKSLVKPALRKPALQHANRSVAVLKHHAAKIGKVVSAITRAKAVNDAFVDVKTGKNASSWADQSELADLQEQLGNMRMAARSAIGGSRIRAVLYSGGSGTNTANTAIGASIQIVPSQSAEWAAYSGLYDEVKVDKVVVHYMVGFTAAATAAVPSGGGVFCAVGYDSTYNSTPTSITEVMESDQHQLISAQSVINGATIPNKTHTFEIRIPPGPVANFGNTTTILPNFPGEWMAIGDPNDSVGYFRIYIEAGGTGCIMGYRLITEYHCSFRERT